MRVVAAPWTQALSMSWRPALKFYEERVAILRAMDAKGALKAFKVRADRIDARLENGHALTVQSDGVTLELFGRDADLDSVWEFVMIVFDSVEPMQVSDVHAQFQHLVALDMPFERAVATGHERFFSLPSIAGTEFGDWALLADLVGAGGMEGQVEFGIIRGAEAPERLTRAVGRTMSLGPGARRWNLDDFPEVSLFADSRWSHHGTPIAAEKPDDLRAFWDAASKQATDLVDALYGKMSN